MPMKQTILLALLLVCGAAQSADWVSLGKNDSGKAEVFVDVTTIKVTGPMRLAWVKAAAAHHTEKGVGTDKGKWVTYYLTRFSFDCDDGTSLIEGGMIYFDDGTNTTLPAAAFSASWEPVAPDTGMHTIMDFTCSWKPTSQTGDPPSQNGDPHLSDVGRSTPAQGIMTIQLPDCGKGYYPSQALRLGQHGAAVVRVCIGIDNKISGPIELVTTSGFPMLDEAAAKCMATGRFKAGTIEGKPVQSCKNYKVTF
jgi:hypothetical protein